jgi:uncharacterized transporter YbjL
LVFYLEHPLNQPNPIVIALRWACVLPAAFLGSAIGPIITNLLALHNDLDVVSDMAHTTGFGGHWWMGPLVSVLQGASMAGFAVGVGLWVAPNYKRETAFTIAGLVTMVVLAIAVMFVLACIKVGSPPWDSWVRLGLTSVAATGTAFSIAHALTTKP